ncbi:MAG: DsbA family oxidoreductase [Flavobacteriales bacterium]|nr:DsbA family oxidoreductase [Flavobacteriales bacterium]
MLIEIWSDVVCPFCYIGKRKLEKALSKFTQISNPQIVWKSYQLMPDLDPKDYGLDLHQYLSTKYHISIDEAKEMNQRVSSSAASYGLRYNLENAVVVNTLDAHRLSHLAAKHGKQNEMEEILFRSYFTDGVDIAQHVNLIKLGTEIGINQAEIEGLFSGVEFSQEVEMDIYESRQIGIRGVPFFLFERKYTISGAQDDIVFNQTLEKILQEGNLQNE